MLPYRLRPPVYGGKLKQKKKQAGLTAADATASYREGGPLERAVRADLLRLRPLFVEKLESYARSVECRTHNVAKGRAFAIFKDVFGTNRVAMLHRPESSGLMIARCDRNSYSQMLYSICLSMIRETIRAYNVSVKERNDRAEHNDKADTDENLGVLLQDVAFAIFTLYALYKTNSLPNGPTIESSKNEYLSLLPFDLSDRQNSRICYRRAFKAPVRIDPEQYSHLLQLRDLACVQQCRCKAAALKQQPWKYECAVSIDVAAVLDRILSPSSNMLDFCAYTGPCGLEGLAGHSDYKTIALTRDMPEEDPPLETAASAVQDETMTSMSFAYSGLLHEQMKKYISDRSAIRLPAERPNMALREKRIRSEIKSVFQKGIEYKQHKDDPLWNQLVSGLVGADEDEKDPQKLLKRMRHRSNRVTFGAVVHHNEEEIVDDALASVPDIPVDDASTLIVDAGGRLNVEENATSSYELVLPDTISADERSTLRTIVKTLVDRDQSLLSPTGIGTVLTREEISTMDSAHSVADTTVSNVGRCALQNLLSLAGRPERQYVTKHGSVAERPVRAVTGDLFLSVSTAGDEFKEVDDEGDSALSDDSSDMGEDSVAASLVGQRALQDLLSDAGRKSHGAPSRKRNRSDESDENTGVWTDGEGDSDTIRELSVGESMVGQRALQDLLSAVPTGGNNHGRRTTDLRRKAKSTQSNLQQMTFENESHSDDGKDFAEPPETSVADSRAGQQALRYLLSAADGGGKSQGGNEAKTTRQRVTAAGTSVPDSSQIAGNNSSDDQVVNGDPEDTTKKGGRAESKILLHRERPSWHVTRLACSESGEMERDKTRGKRSRNKRPTIPSRRSTRRTKSQRSDSGDSKDELYQYSSSEEDSRTAGSRVGQEALQDLLVAVTVEGGRLSSKANRKRAPQANRDHQSGDS